MHSHEASTGRWLMRKGLWKEVALASGLRKAMNPNWQRRVGACLLRGEGRGRTPAKAVGQQCRAMAPQESKRRAAATGNSSLFSSVEESQHRKKENFLVYLLSPGTPFLFQFLSLSVASSFPTWQLHASLEFYHDHGLLQTALGDSCYFFSMPISVYTRLRNIEAFSLIILYFSTYYVSCFVLVTEDVAWTKQTKPLPL